MLLHFALVLHLAAILITFCVNITFVAIITFCSVTVMLQELNHRGSLEKRYRSIWKIIHCRSDFDYVNCFVLILSVKG